MDENNILDIEQSDETGDDISVVTETDSEDGEQIETYALTDSVDGTISDTYLDYFEGIVQKLPYDSNYVIWRSGDYSYTMAYGEEIEEENGVFTGSCDYVRIYRETADYSSNWLVSDGTDMLNLVAGEAFVYSNLGMFPTVERGLSSLEAETLLFGLAVAFVFSIVTGLFSRIGIRHRR